jgi:hypothetical protein
LYEGRQESDEMRSQRVSISPRAGTTEAEHLIWVRADMLLEQTGRHKQELPRGIPSTLELSREQQPPIMAVSETGTCNEQMCLSETCMSYSQHAEDLH